MSDLINLIYICERSLVVIALFKIGYFIRSYWSTGFIRENNWMKNNIIHISIKLIKLFNISRNMLKMQ